jgi:hypothetical protein
MRMAVATLLITTTLSLAARCGDDGAPLPVVTACRAGDAACATSQAGAERPPPEVDREALAVLRADPAVSAILEGKVPGEDYWLAFEGRSDGERGERLSTITVILREEVRYSGSIPRFTDPCSGVTAEDEVVPPAHPCRIEPRAYVTAVVEWAGGSHLLHAVVDVGRDAVVDLFNPYADGDIDDVIAYYDRYYDGSY